MSKGTSKLGKTHNSAHKDAEINGKIDLFEKLAKINNELCVEKVQKSNNIKVEVQVNDSW
jgi:YbbR domain-containing protein